MNSGRFTFDFEVGFAITKAWSLFEVWTASAARVWVVREGWLRSIMTDVMVLDFEHSFVTLAALQHKLLNSERRIADTDGALLHFRRR